MRTRSGMLAISPAVRSFSVSSSRIFRRVGSARARNSESSIGVDIIHCLKYVNYVTKSAPITAAHMSPADKAWIGSGRAPCARGLLVANVAVRDQGHIGTLTGSRAVLGDALHSSVDAVYNVLGLVACGGVSRAGRGAPYGHGKFETLGALAIVVSSRSPAFELSGAHRRLVSGGHVVQDDRPGAPRPARDGRHAHETQSQDVRRPASDGECNASPRTASEPRQRADRRALVNEHRRLRPPSSPASTGARARDRSRALSAGDMVCKLVMGAGFSQRS